MTEFLCRALWSVHSSLASNMVNLLALLKLRLQHLTVILHSLHVALGLGSLLHSRGVDVPVRENVGRHVELLI